MWVPWYGKYLPPRICRASPEDREKPTTQDIRASPGNREMPGRHKACPYNGMGTTASALITRNVSD